MSKHLQHQIEALKQKILLVGTLVEDAIAKAISALVNRNGDLARGIIERDAEIDRMEVDVEEECLKVLALYQPVAADLRFVVAVLKINNDLERMGDLARNIAKRVAYLAAHERIDLPAEFRGMAAKAQSMVRRSLDALVNRDTLIARQIRDDDDEVDAMQRIIRDRIEDADPPIAREARPVHAAAVRVATSGTAGRHGHERRRGRDLHGRRRHRPPSQWRLTGPSPQCRPFCSCPADRDLRVQTNGLARSGLAGSQLQCLRHSRRFSTAFYFQNARRKYGLSHPIGVTGGLPRASVPSGSPVSTVCSRGSHRYLVLCGAVHVLHIPPRRGTTSMRRACIPCLALADLGLRSRDGGRRRQLAAVARRQIVGHARSGTRRTCPTPGPRPITSLEDRPAGARLVVAGGVGQ